SADLAPLVSFMPALSSYVRTWRLLCKAYTEFVRDDALTLAAAFAFYTSLSLAPLLILFVWIGSLVGPHAQEDLSTQIDSLIGAEAGSGIRSIIQNSGRHPVLTSISGIVSFIILITTATGVF